jgi:hypothetical protein
VLSSDPADRDVGVDIGFSPSPETLRAPDLSVGEMPDQQGWVQGVPPLAVEYAAGRQRSQGGVPGAVSHCLTLLPVEEK